VSRFFFPSSRLHLIHHPPQLKILDPLFRVGSSRPQRMHNGLALSLLDFLLMTAMILLTPNDEWTNVTRANTSESVADSQGTHFHPILCGPSYITPQTPLQKKSNYGGLPYWRESHSLHLERAAIAVPPELQADYPSTPTFSRRCKIQHTCLDKVSSIRAATHLSPFPHHTHTC
jgi:hypothetical protein